MLVSVSINQLYNHTEQFSMSKKPCGKRATIKGKTMLAIGSIFFSLRVIPMRIENIFKGHLIEKPPKLNHANISVF